MCTSLTVKQLISPDNLLRFFKSVPLDPVLNSSFYEAYV